MNDLNKRLADREITVELSDSARQFIVDHGYDPIYGARPLKRLTETCRDIVCKADPCR